MGSIPNALGVLFEVSVFRKREYVSKKKELTALV